MSFQSLSALREALPMPDRPAICITSIASGLPSNNTPDTLEHHKLVVTVLAELLDWQAGCNVGP